MTHTNTFEEDLKSGQIIEEDVLKLLKNRYPSAFIIKGYCKEYDIFIPEISRGYEVKQDYKSKYTGNIVVEVSMFGKPSALMATKAHVWVFVTHYKYAFIKPERIKDCIIENNLQMKTFTSRGDSNPKDAYLIKEDLLFSYAHNVIDKK
jgi:hypothetical protein|tara:strand:- start:477 stop:923 length:447 start_codon:yes stop_codon:yes gene_type:complete